jgi:hypothetical protein
MSITLEDLKTLPPEDVVEVDSSLNETPPEVILELELEVEVKVLDGGGGGGDVDTVDIELKLELLPAPEDDDTLVLELLKSLDFSFFFCSALLISIVLDELYMLVPPPPETVDVMLVESDYILPGTLVVLEDELLIEELDAGDDELIEDDSIVLEEIELEPPIDVEEED